MTNFPCNDLFHRLMWHPLLRITHANHQLPLVWSSAQIKKHAHPVRRWIYAIAVDLLFSQLRINEAINGTLLHTLYTCYVEMYVDAHILLHTFVKNMLWDMACNENHTQRVTVIYLSHFAVTWLSIYWYSPQLVELW